MKGLLKPIQDLLLYDFKKLVFIEVIIKVLGIVVVYPLFRLGFHLALELSGLKYISNNDLVSFIFKPSTIFIAIILLILFSIYLLIEYVYLLVLYDHAYHKISLTYKEFIVIGFSKFILVLKKYHFFILVPVTLFFLVFEYTQIAIFSSTINISPDILIEIQSFEYFTIFFYMSFALLIIFFIEFIFFTHSFVLKGDSIKKSFIESRHAIKDNRIKLLIRFIIYNIIINAFILLIYGLILLFIGLIVGLYRGEEVIFGFIITSMYSAYLIISFIFTSVLVPLNLAIASYKFYQRNEVIPQNKSQIKYESIVGKSNRWLLIPLSILFIIIFLLNVFTITDNIRNTENQFQFFKQEEIIAHRGASSQAPENTFASIELAIQQGIHSIEIDIQGTVDHVPILLHDPTLDRTTNFNSTLPVNRLNYATIETYDAGSWFSEQYANEKVPRLEDVFKLIEGNPTYFLDIKSDDILVEKEIMRLIEVYDMAESVKIMSFNPDQLLRFKRENSNIETVLLISTFYGNINTLIRSESIDHFALRITILQNHPDVIKRIHEFGKTAYAWTVDNEEEINIGVRADVDGFITKRPLDAREIAHSKNSNISFKEFLDRLFSGL
ncbi:glycerophosphoryl diester phosphodiesterase membrane domain-containing protein [Mycoplasmatota bacterium]|nr:glycerophosphoryl diester phosphodiesterase membrane domain-containing protein [Mycoplasmatota bacterium]